MQKINFENKPSMSTPINATNLNQLQTNVEDAIHEIGSTYVSQENPSTLFGGTWEQIKTFAGGELLAFGSAYNGTGNSSKVNKDEDLSFSDSKIPNKIYIIDDYIGNILTFEAGTFRINTRNLVGMVEAIYTVSGVFDGKGSLWFKPNSNTLPSGVVIHNNETGPILGFADAQYNGASRTYFYKIDESITENIDFFVNPVATAYNTSFTPAQSGVKCELLVKVYAKKNITYLWKRTA